MANATVNPGIVNNYTVKPRNLTQYTAYRGVTDFTQIAQFDPFETGYSFLSVISMPRFIDILAQEDQDIRILRNSFKHILEYEFKGMNGLPTLEGATGTISDGINELQYINKVTMDTSIQVSMEAVEHRGAPITKFQELYLTGIKDRMTQAKTYHGLIKSNKLAPGLENEVFTLMYYVTDNTMCRLERAVLLCNCQLTSADLGSLYNSTKGNIENVNVTINFNAFPVMGVEVDKAAKSLLEDITGTTVNYSSSDRFTPVFGDNKQKGIIADETNFGYTNHGAVLDSTDYAYGILQQNASARGAGVNNTVLSTAITRTNRQNS